MVQKLKKMVTGFFNWGKLFEVVLRAGFQTTTQKEIGLKVKILVVL